MAEHKRKKVWVEGPISPAFIADSIAKHSSKTDIGAHSIFLGQIRQDEKEGRHVTAIEYTAHTEMANEQFHVIREAMFEKYALTCMHIYHSLGTVNTGEISLFVFTSSAHRRDAIEACQETVERIKQEVAIWGKELLEDGGYVWKEPR